VNQQGDSEAKLLMSRCGPNSGEPDTTPGMPQTTGSEAVRGVCSVRTVPQHGLRVCQRVLDELHAVGADVQALQFVSPSRRP
jgi:hypothetical protein